MAIIGLESFCEPNTIAHLNDQSAPSVSSSRLAVYANLGFGSIDDVYINLIGKLSQSATSGVRYCTVVKSDGRGWLAATRSYSSVTVTESCALVLNSAMVANKCKTAGSKVVFGFRAGVAVGDMVPRAPVNFVNVRSGSNTHHYIGENSIIVQHTISEEAYYEISVDTAEDDNAVITVYKNKKRQNSISVKHSTGWAISVNLTNLNLDYAVGGVLPTTPRLNGVTDIVLIADAGQDPVSTHTGFLGPVRLMPKAVAVARSAGATAPLVVPNRGVYNESHYLVGDAARELNTPRRYSYISNRMITTENAIASEPAVDSIADIRAALIKDESDRVVCNMQTIQTTQPIVAVQAFARMRAAPLGGTQPTVTIASESDSALRAQGPERQTVPNTVYDFSRYNSSIVTRQSNGAALTESYVNSMTIELGAKGIVRQ